jgi:hypothetical protein
MRAILLWSPEMPASSCRRRPLSAPTAPERAETRLWPALICCASVPGSAARAAGERVPSHRRTAATSTSTTVTPKRRVNVLVVTDMNSAAPVRAPSR